MSEIDPHDLEGADGTIQGELKTLRRRVRSLSRRNVRASSLDEFAGDAGVLGVMDLEVLRSSSMTGALHSVAVPADNMVALGGYVIVSKGAGLIAEDIASGETTVDFGETMTVGDWVKIQTRDAEGNFPVEWMLVGSLVTGTTYNVTRDVDGSGAKSWKSGTPFAVIGQNGDNRIELIAGASATVQLITQGATWNAYTVQAEMSTVNGAITSGSGVVRLNADGIEILVGTSAADLNSYKLLDSGGATMARFTGYDNVGIFGVLLESLDIPLEINAGTAHLNLMGDAGIVVYDDLKMNAKVVAPKASNLTIASDAITVTGMYHRVDTESAAATDDLATINGGEDGQLLILATVNSGRDVTLNETGNIKLGSGTTRTLDNINDRIVLMNDGTNWIELSFADNN